MDRKPNVPVTLQADLKQFFEQQGLPEEDADQLIARIWNEVAEAFDFADFVRQTMDGPGTGAEIDVVPAPNISEEEYKERLAFIQERYAHSRGKWA